MCGNSERAAGAGGNLERRQGCFSVRGFTTLGKINDLLKQNYFLQQNNRDPSIATTQVGIVFQFGMGLQNFPYRVIRLGPILTEDAGLKLTVLRHLYQTILHRDANLATFAG